MVLHQPEKGIAQARNRALRYSRHIFKYPSHRRVSRIDPVSFVDNNWLTTLRSGVIGPDAVAMVAAIRTIATGTAVAGIAKSTFRASAGPPRNTGSATNQAGADAIATAHAVGCIVGSTIRVPRLESWANFPDRRTSQRFCARSTSSSRWEARFRSSRPNNVSMQRYGRQWPGCAIKGHSQSAHPRAPAVKATIGHHGRQPTRIIIVAPYGHCDMLRGENREGIGGHDYGVAGVAWYARVRPAL
jgi:hypothetical protein